MFRGYLTILFVMVNVCNLLKENITYPMANITKFVGLVAGYFWFL